MKAFVLFSFLLLLQLHLFPLPFVPLPLSLVPGFSHSFSLFTQKKAKTLPETRPIDYQSAYEHAFTHFVIPSDRLSLNCRLNVIITSVSRLLSDHHQTYFLITIKVVNAWLTPSVHINL